MSLTNLSDTTMIDAKHDPYQAYIDRDREKRKRLENKNKRTLIGEVSGTYEDKDRSLLDDYDGDYTMDTDDSTRDDSTTQLQGGYNYVPPGGSAQNILVGMRVNIKGELSSVLIPASLPSNVQVPTQTTYGQPVLNMDGTPNKEVNSGWMIQPNTANQLLAQKGPTVGVLAPEAIEGLRNVLDEITTVRIDPVTNVATASGDGYIASDNAAIERHNRTNAEIKIIRKHLDEVNSELESIVKVADKAITKLDKLMVEKDNMEVQNLEARVKSYKEHVETVEKHKKVVDELEIKLLENRFEAQKKDITVTKRTNLLKDNLKMLTRQNQQYLDKLKEYEEQTVRYKQYSDTVVEASEKNAKMFQEMKAEISRLLNENIVDYRDYNILESKFEALKRQVEKTPLKEPVKEVSQPEEDIKEEPPMKVVKSFMTPEQVEKLEDYENLKLIRELILANGPPGMKLTKSSFIELVDSKIREQSGETLVKKYIEHIRNDTRNSSEVTSYAQDLLDIFNKSGNSPISVLDRMVELKLATESDLQATKLSAQKYLEDLQREKTLNESHAKTIKELESKTNVMDESVEVVDKTAMVEGQAKFIKDMYHGSVGTMLALQKQIDDYKRIEDIQERFHRDLKLRAQNYLEGDLAMNELTTWDDPFMNVDLLKGIRDIISELLIRSNEKIYNTNHDNEELKNKVNVLTQKISIYKNNIRSNEKHDLDKMELQSYKDMDELIGVVNKAVDNLNDNGGAIRFDKALDLYRINTMKQSPHVNALYSHVLPRDAASPLYRDYMIDISQRRNKLDMESMRSQAVVALYKRQKNGAMDPGSQLLEVYESSLDNTQALALQKYVERTMERLDSGKENINPTALDDWKNIARLSILQDLLSQGEVAHFSPQTFTNIRKVMCSGSENDYKATLIHGIVHDVVHQKSTEHTHVERSKTGVYIKYMTNLCMAGSGMVPPVDNVNTYNRLRVRCVEIMSENRFTPDTDRVLRDGVDGEPYVGIEAIQGLLQQKRDNLTSGNGQEYFKVDFNTNATQSSMSRTEFEEPKEEPHKVVSRKSIIPSNYVKPPEVIVSADNPFKSGSKKIRDSDVVDYNKPRTYSKETIDVNGSGVRKVKEKNPPQKRSSETGVSKKIIKKKK